MAEMGHERTFLDQLPRRKKMPTPFAHIVFFTLKDQSPESRLAFAEECRKYLTGHPGTLYFSAAVQSDNDREVNDREFDVALHLVFKDRESQDQYQVAPRHDEFIAANSDRWASVRVFDSNVVSQEFGDH